MNRLARVKRGFTLIEMLTVIAIIAILSTVAIPQYLKARKKAQMDSEGKGNLAAILAQLEMEKQLSLSKSYPLAGCLGKQVVDQSTTLCPEAVCDEFHYTSEIGSENAKPGFCFIVDNLVTAPNPDPTKPDRVTGFTILADGRDGRVNGTQMTIDERGKVDVVHW